MRSRSTHSATQQDSGGSPAFFADERFAEGLSQLGLTSLEAVFAFDSGRDLAKPNIGRFRRRLQFEVVPAGAEHPVKVYLKRYDRPPIAEQLRNWLSHHRRMSFAQMEHEAATQLASAGVRTPQTVAWGEEWGVLFERRSFLMTEAIQDSRSLESALPSCFAGPATTAKRHDRRDLIRRLASFVRRFHRTGHRHRDLYLSHIFCSDQGEFCLIDLARASKPFLRRRYQIKDIAQLHYSSPSQAFSRTDRLRFYLVYVGRSELLPEDKTFIRRVVRKALRMARHNRKRGNRIPFLERTGGE